MVLEALVFKILKHYLELSSYIGKLLIYIDKLPQKPLYNLMLPRLHLFSKTGSEFWVFSRTDFQYQLPKYPRQHNFCGIFFYAFIMIYFTHFEMIILYVHRHRITGSVSQVSGTKIIFEIAYNFICYTNFAFFVWNKTVWLSFYVKYFV